MKKLKKLVSVVVVLVLMFSMLAFAGCSKETPAYVTGIAMTQTIGNVDVYTIYYSDGSTSTMQVTNGKDGQNATALDFYNEYVNIYGEISYADFLELFLTLETEGYSAINSCLASSAKVYSAFDVPTQSSGYLPQISSTEKKLSAGSAVIFDIDDDYTYFITNYHVVYYAGANTPISDEIHCYLYGSERYPEQKNADAGIYYDYGEFAIECEFIGGTPTYDIAVIRAETQSVKAINPNVCEIKFAEDYYVGETAIAIGNPNDAGLSVTQGVVSVDSEYIYLDVDGNVRTHRSIRIDTALYEGNSGGGLFNVEGELIGICNAGKKTDQNINYAVPLSIVKGAVANIMHYHNDGNDQTQGLYKITIGVTVTGKNSRYEFDKDLGFGKIKEDVLIQSVVEGSIVDKLGLKAGDIMTAFNYDGNRVEVDRYFEIGDYILYLKEGSVFYIEYMRDGVEYKTQSYQVLASDLVLA